MYIPSMQASLPTYGYSAVPSGTPHSMSTPAQDALPTSALSAPATADTAQNTPGAFADTSSPEQNIAREKALAKIMNDRFEQECQTCKSRRYQDGSNDPGVSFKSPTHIDPAASASAVMGHEMEHVTRNAAKAKSEGGEVISSDVVLHGAVCPECKRFYISGGTTYTTTRHGGQDSPNAESPSDGGKLDTTA